jgi:molybdenum cofactor cytidylyltransferase
MEKPLLSLAQALRLAHNACVAFVGAGGKTSAMFRVAQELAPALVTTTTHLGAWQASKASRHIIWSADKPMPDMEATLGNGITLVTGPLTSEKNRLTSLTLSQLEQLKQLADYHTMPLLIEADGSRQKPLKAPADHEPAIPGFVDTVVVAVGLSGLNQPLTEDHLHRAEIFGKISGLKLEETINEMAVARVLVHPLGGIKNIPSAARRVALLNQADTPGLQAQANAMEALLLTAFDAVVISTLAAPQGGNQRAVLAIKENIGAVVLAAGAATRYGQPKQLLDYHGQPFVRVIAENALKAGLTPVIVVCGAYGPEVSQVLDGLPVFITHNPDWQTGQSSSLKVGIRQLPAKNGGAIFLLADQPQVSVELLRALVERHSQDLPAVLAPYVFDQRANPILFDRITFKDLSELTGDTGGRAIFSKFSPRYLNWYDRRLLLDVDTPEDYARLLESET